jgi:hypothetical protein
MKTNKLFPINNPSNLDPENNAGEYIDRYIHINLSFADRIRILLSGRAFVRHIIKVDKPVDFTDDSSFTVVPPMWIQSPETNN